uniref:GUN4 domain-containing protein n=1 Tax=Oscillatoriales cyanobacterium SpSt-402 TaxID=2282168 RepID=A0A832M4P3_9CYAN
MAKSNRTAFILTSLVILGLFSLAGAVTLLALRMQLNSGSSSTSTSSVESTPSSPALPGERSQALEQVPLESDRGVDYRKLREYLQQRNWKAADQETYERLLDAAGPKAQSQGFTPQDEMDRLSCKDLRTVDQLWSNASNGRFGFTSQQNILRALGDYRKMYAQVGWQRSSGEWLIEWNYDPQTRRINYRPGKEPDFTSPPSGHLPTVERGYNFDVSLDAALKRCNF